MGREIRRVPRGWQHPKDARGRLVPLRNGFAAAAAEFAKRADEKGLESALDYFGGKPLADEYMPEWPEAECTHLMMYETCSEGTPISPAFATPEELARWLADTGASAFGDMTATYEQWLAMARKGWAPSGVIVGGVMASGVAAVAAKKA